MFWRVASGSVASSVEAIISGGNFTLEQLLAEGDLVQEIKQPNEQLVEYLLKEDTLEELMHFLVDPPAESMDEESKFSLPLAACEVVCCEAEEIADAIVSRPKMFDILFAMPDQKLASDSAMSGYFARTVAYLMTQKGPELFTWLQANPGVLTDLTERLETMGAAETLVRLVGADDQTTEGLSQDQMAWLADTDVLDILLDKMKGKQGAVVAENAVEVLAAVARARSSPLTHLLGSAANIQCLIDYTAEPSTPPHSLAQTLTICIALVERRSLWQTASDNELAKSPPQEEDSDLEQRAVSMLAPHAANLLKRMSEDNDQPLLETPYGLQKPLGSTRLTVLALVAVTLRTGMREAEQAVEDSVLLSLCLLLFTQYPFNSILHHQVATILGCIMDRGSDAILKHLLETCNFVDWLIGAPMEVTATPAKGDIKVRALLRAGYTGHITQIGCKLLETAESRPQMDEHLSQHAGWQEFAAGRLTKARGMEDLAAWECGRPDLNSKNTGNSDEAFFMEGDLAVPGNFSSFEANSFGIQSAFNIDSGSDEDSPTRADTLFADADEFADELMGSPPCYREDDPAESDAKEFVPKSFDQRTRSFSASRPDERMADGSIHADLQEEEMENIDLGSPNSPLPNGSATKELHLLQSQPGSNLPESWESLADGDRAPGGQEASPPSPGKTGPLGRSPKRILRGSTPAPVSCFQDPQDTMDDFVGPQGKSHTGEEEGGKDKTPTSSPPQNAAPSFPKGSREWDENDPTPTLENGLPGKLMGSPLKQALVSGSSIPDSPPAPPAVDHAELRQPGEPKPPGVDGLNALDGKGAEVSPPLHNSPPVRRRKSLGSARKSRDIDSHPLSLGRKNSLDNDLSGMRRNSLDDISEEISAALATELKEDAEELSSTSATKTEPSPPLGEEQTLVGSFTKLELGGASEADSISHTQEQPESKDREGKSAEKKGKQGAELPDGWDKPDVYLQMLDHSPRQAPPL